MIKDEKFDLAVLLLISLLLSIYLFFRTYVISLDGAFQYIPIAKDFASGLFRKALSHNQQPLYPLIVAFVSQYVPDFEWAGKLVSSLFGILVIFPVYFLGRRIFDGKVAFLSSLLLAIHPYLRRYSADVLKESTYLFFLATALWFAWRTIDNGRRFPFLFIPFFSALAYLVRPDGIEIVLVVLFYILFINKFDTRAKRWSIVLILFLSSIFLFLPYLIHLRETGGEWTLSRAKTLTWFLGLKGTGGVPLVHKIIFALKKLIPEFYSIYHFFYIFLLVIGLLKRGLSLFKRGEAFLFSLFVLHYAVLFLLVLNLTEWSGKETIQAVYFSGRYVLPLLLFSIYWVGEGLIVIQQWIYNKIKSSRLFLRGDPKERPVVLWGILLLLVLTIVLPKTLKPQRYDRLPEKWAGRWVENQSGKGVTIFTTLPRVAYYAEGNFEFIDFDKGVPKDIEASMVKKGAVYLVLRGREILGYPEVAEHLKRDFIEAERYEEKGMEKVVIYKRTGSSP
jgi:hypothetical protein